jgi:pyruvate ferredoxin oxidoreductase gamma subunit
MIEGIYQIRIHSRGGQGAKTAGQILAESAIAQGDFAQAFSEYGPERSGAPMKTFFRFSKKEIRLHGDVENPDIVVVLDPSLLGTINVLEGLEKDGFVLINTPKATEEIAEILQNKKVKIVALDASSISMKALGKNLPNTPIVGAIAKLLPQISYKEIEKVTREHFGRKLSAELVEKNLQAMEKGYEAF